MFSLVLCSYAFCFSRYVLCDMFLGQFLKACVMVIIDGAALCCPGTTNVIQAH
jgi:hypothetical protein